MASRPPHHQHAGASSGFPGLPYRGQPINPMVYPTNASIPPMRFAGLVPQQPGAVPPNPQMGWFPAMGQHHQQQLPQQHHRGAWAMQQKAEGSQRPTAGQQEQQQGKKGEDKAKERHFLQQQQRLKAMSTQHREPLNADTLIESMFSKKEDFLPKAKAGGAQPEMEPLSLPLWLTDSSLAPESYQKVYEYVGEPKCMVDTQRLTQLLAYSNLPRETLGFLWTLVNHQVPGQLTQQELYMLLALVGVVQAGYNFTDLSILQKFPHPIIPAFNSPPPSQASQHPTHPMHPTQSPVQPVQPTQPTMQPVQPAQSASEPIKPIQPTMQSMQPTQPVVQSIPHAMQPTQPAMQPVQAKPTLHNDDEDEFSDFQCATEPKKDSSPPPQPQSQQQPQPRIRKTSRDFAEGTFSPVFQPKFPQSQTSIVGSRLANYDLRVSSKSTVSPVKQQTDDFSDFQSASETKADRYEALRKTEKDEDLLIGSEDKYSVFRELQDDHGEENNANEPAPAEEEFGDFLSGPVEFKAEFPENPVENEFQPGNWAMGNGNENFADFVVEVESAEQTKRALETVDYSDPFGEFQEGGSVAPENRTEDEFGDFLGPTPPPEVEKIAEGPSPETQSVSSLDLGCIILEGKSSLSRQGSLPSLDLKISGSLGGDVAEGVGQGGMGNSSEEFGVLQSAMSNLAIGDGKFKFSPPGPLGDKYSAVRDDVLQNEDRHTYEWGRCLQSCLELIQYAVTAFNSVSSSQIVKEVVGTEEGSNYLSSVVEVYRVTCRIGQSYRKHSSETKLQPVLSEIGGAWESLKPYLAGTTILPEDAAFDFGCGILTPEPENLEKACGVCLLDTDTPSKVFNRTEDCQKLSYGGRQYHASCANLWVNCVDSILPALPFIFLL